MIAYSLLDDVLRIVRIVSLSIILFHSLENQGQIIRNSISFEHSLRSLGRNLCSSYHTPVSIELVGSVGLLQRRLTVKTDRNYLQRIVVIFSILSRTFQGRNHLHPYSCRFLYRLDYIFILYFHRNPLACL